jgi:hypothetical protein
MENGDIFGFLEIRHERQENISQQDNYMINSGEQSISKVRKISNYPEILEE